MEKILDITRMDKGNVNNRLCVVEKGRLSIGEFYNSIYVYFESKSTKKLTLFSENILRNVTLTPEPVDFCKIFR
jgi:penicillin-binding protein-related factor A (putative recombinase)